MNKKIREILKRLTLHCLVAGEFDINKGTDIALTAIDQEIKRCMGVDKRHIMNSDTRTCAEVRYYNQRAKDFYEKWRSR